METNSKEDEQVTDALIAKLLSRYSPLQASAGVIRRHPCYPWDELGEILDSGQDLASLLAE